MLTVNVKPSYEVREIMGESRVGIEVEEGTTVNGLLRELVRSYGPKLKKVLLDAETGEIKSFYRILLGGREISQFQKGMDTALNEHDVVSITLIPYAGG
jgi:molybdopterin converting factor small subunit